mmetsp:Transcript_44711/g.107891  ORF Transcript_44711/g.107891 Transcript_44711/m.107891 type:complete len:229 (-) Transcript_44711:298-984(-)
MTSLLHTNNNNDNKFRLWTDEEYFKAKRALVEMLCEEVDAEDEDLPPEKFVGLVAQRIVLPEDDDVAKNDREWKRNMAKQMILLGTTVMKTTTTGKSPPSPRRYWDKQKIAKWALYDLILTSRRSTWPLEELLSTWQSRLPLLWCNERIPAPKRKQLQETETEDSQESTDFHNDEDDITATSSNNNKDVASRQALEAMSEVEIFVPESDGKKKKNDDAADVEMVELKF